MQKQLLTELIFKRTFYVKKLFNIFTQVWKNKSNLWESLATPASYHQKNQTWIFVLLSSNTTAYVCIDGFNFFGTRSAVFWNFLLASLEPFWFQSGCLWSSAPSLSILVHKSTAISSIGVNFCMLPDWLRARLFTWFFQFCIIWY